MLDSHCHLDDARFTDLPAVEARRQAAGVRVLVPAVHPDGWATLRSLAGRHGWMFALGTHPERLDGLADPLPHDLLGAVAIGECGLHRPSAVPMARQIEVLCGHLAIARDARLPVILHCVRAHDELPRVLRHFGCPIRGVLHSYGGGPELVPVYEALGLHLSFGGAITWRGARKPLEALRRVSADRLLLESDGPDQRPWFEHDTWGPQSEPAMVPALLHAAAASRRTGRDELERQLEQNARALGW